MTWLSYPTERRKGTDPVTVFCDYRIEFFHHLGIRIIEVGGLLWVLLEVIQLCGRRAFLQLAFQCEVTVRLLG